MLETRLEAMDAATRQSLKMNGGAIDASSSALGKRDRSLAEPTNSGSSRRDTPAAGMAADLAVTHAHAQWWSPELTPRMEASPSAAAEGVDGAISAWIADERDHILGQELTPEEENIHADLVGAGKLREFEASGKFDVSSPHEACEVQQQTVQTR